jgi:hypothetical protein
MIFGPRQPLPALAAVGCLLLTLGSAFAEPAKGESEYLVPPGGGAFDIPIHAGEVCILSFRIRPTVTI